MLPRRSEDYRTLLWIFVFAPLFVTLHLFAFFFRQYLLAPFWPQLGTTHIGRAPFDDGVEPAVLNQAAI